MYVLAPNQAVEKFPYSIGDLRKDNPQVSFPRNPSPSLLANYSVFPVVGTGVNYDPATQVATQDGCIYNAQLQRWETAWTVRDKTAEELQADAQREQEEQDRIAVKEDQLIQAFISRTPAEVNSYIDAQVTDLASARNMLKLFGRILLIMARREYK